MKLDLHWTQEGQFHQTPYNTPHYVVLKQAKSSKRNLDTTDFYEYVVACA